MDTCFAEQSGIVWEQSHRQTQTSLSKYEEARSKLCERRGHIYTMSATNLE